MCVAVEEEAVVTLLYPYLVQFIAIDSFGSIEATVHQPKRLGSSALAITLLNATKSTSGNMLAIQIVASYHDCYKSFSKERSHLLSNVQHRSGCASLRLSVCTKWARLHALSRTAMNHSVSPNVTYIQCLQYLHIYSFK